jgi:hypothetical protein
MVSPKRTSVRVERHARDRHFWAFAQACPCPAPGPGRPGPAARSQHYLFHGFQLTRENKATKRPKDKSMCARRDAIAQRCSPGLASNRSIVKPLSPPPRHTCMVQAEHPSPSARQFRLLPNGLAISELRRMLSPKRAHPSSRVIWRCDYGAIVVPGACPSRGGGRHVPGTHTAVPILISKSGATVKRRKRRTGFTAISMRSLNDPRRGSLPTVLLHLDQVQTGHPSPSAHQFRLPFNGLPASQLRRMI